MLEDTYNEESFNGYDDTSKKRIKIHVDYW